MVRVNEAYKGWLAFAARLLLSKYEAAKTLSAIKQTRLDGLSNAYLTIAISPYIYTFSNLFALQMNRVSLHHFYLGLEKSSLIFSNFTLHTFVTIRVEARMTRWTIAEKSL